MDKHKLAMVLFLVSEGVFFLLLILTYCLFHGRHSPGLSSREVLDPLRTGIFSLFLLGSSLSVAVGERRWVRGETRAAFPWFCLTIALGLVFLYGQGTEWWALAHRDLSISRDLFGASFFTLTGFHGLHVAVGLMLLAVLAVFSWRGREKKTEAGAGESISLYWHFVDGVWVLIFGVVYLWPIL